MTSTMVSVVLWLVSGFVALIFMEFWAEFLHHRVWHGPLWPVHRSHHEPRTGRFEFNDVLSATHAPVAAGLILYGCLGAPSILREIAYGWGFGMTAFGLLYLTFHDGLMHGRLPVQGLRRFAYFRLLCDAHQIHHEKNGGPYGFFYVPPKLRAHLARRQEAARPGGVLPAS